MVKKVRGRVRQPTTSTEQPETTRRSVAVRTRASYNRNTSRDQQRDSSRERVNVADEEPKVSRSLTPATWSIASTAFFSLKPFQPRFRIRENTPRFRLETQESQWSSRFNQNSFHPIDDKDDYAKSSLSDDEQEIITAGPETEEVRTRLEVVARVK